jgi:hypothetical protein
MKKICFLIVCGLFFAMGTAQAQMASLNKAKYITTLKVIADHKINDDDIIDDVDKLREYDKFKKDLKAMIDKLDNSHPREAKNQKIMRILEKAGKEIYEELK